MNISLFSKTMLGQFDGRTSGLLFQIILSSQGNNNDHSGGTQVKEHKKEQSPHVDRDGVDRSNKQETFTQLIPTHVLVYCR